jgi:hypothetical protein
LSARRHSCGYRFSEIAGHGIEIDQTNIAQFPYFILKRGKIGLKIEPAPFVALVKVPSLKPDASHVGPCGNQAGREGVL